MKQIRAEMIFRQSQELDRRKEVIETTLNVISGIIQKERSGRTNKTPLDFIIPTENGLFWRIQDKSELCYLDAYKSKRDAEEGKCPIATNIVPDQGITVENQKKVYDSLDEMLAALFVRIIGLEELCEPFLSE